MPRVGPLQPTIMEPNTTDPPHVFVNNVGGGGDESSPQAMWTAIASIVAAFALVLYALVMVAVRYTALVEKRRREEARRQQRGSPATSSGNFSPDPFEEAVAVGMQAVQDFQGVQAIGVR